MDLFDYAIEEKERNAAQQAANDAIARVGNNADPSWMQTALDAVRSIAIEQHRRFTTDDVWALLAERNVPAPREPRALGAVIRVAQKQGMVRATGDYVKSRRTECHGRPVMVWEENHG